MRRLNRRLRTPRSAIGAGAPEHVTGAAVVEPTDEDKEVVRQAVEIFERLWVDGLGAGELADQALGSPRHGAPQMEIRGRRRTAGQDKRVERPQRRIHRVDLALEALDLGCNNPQRTGRAAAALRGAQIGAEVEEVVLDAVE